MRGRSLMKRNTALGKAFKIVPYLTPEEVKLLALAVEAQDAVR